MILSDSLSIIMRLDYEYIEIVVTSLTVSLFSIFFSFVISMPIAALLSMSEFKGKSLVIVIINSLMALPPVVVGLILYLLLSSQGFFSELDLLYTVTAMIIAQSIIITPIIISLSIESLNLYYNKYSQFLQSLHATLYRRVTALLWEARSNLMMNTLAGLGRSLSEVGAIIIVGGNIAHVSRTMTTGIVLETSRGELATALSLGITLISISITINAIVYILKKREA